MHAGRVQGLGRRGSGPGWTGQRVREVSLLASVFRAEEAK